MPRGNDAKEALHELADKFGSGVGNAEGLIQANLEARSRALQAAEMLPRDHEATKEARGKLSSFKGPDGAKAVDVAVRGQEGHENRYTCVVFESKEGRHFVAVVDKHGKIIDDTRGEQTPSAEGDGDGSSKSSKTSD